MAKILLTTPAAEQSAYAIEVSFFDAAGDPVAPKTLFWSLLDQSGVVINGKQDVAVDNPAAVELIVLRGDDLQMADQTVNREARALRLSATYDDATLGADCPLRADIFFGVEKRMDVATA